MSPHPDDLGMRKFGEPLAAEVQENNLWNKESGAIIQQSPLGRVWTPC